MNDSESNQSVGALDSLGHETNRSPSGYGDGSGQPSRAQSSWQSLWSRSPTAVGSEGATLLSHASSSTADTEAAYDHDHIKPRNAGNKTASGGDAYGTFFISQENADCDSEESEKEDFGVPNHRHPSVQAMLLTSATLGLMAVFTFVTSKPETDETLLFIVLDNVPTAFLFFFASEIIAQTVAFGSIWDVRRCDLIRAARAGCFGIAMNGVGYTFWLMKLSALIPMAETGVGSENAITLLVVKMCMDSYIWGTFSNTMGLAGRRMILEGDTIAEAQDAWYRTILPVMWDEVKFWPTWTVINFLIIPTAFQVNFTSLGSFIWNCYMAWVAHCTKPHHHEIDDLAGAARSPPLRAKVAAMSPGLRSRPNSLAPSPHDAVATPSTRSGEGAWLPAASPDRMEPLRLGNRWGGGKSSGEGARGMVTPV